MSPVRISPASMLAAFNTQPTTLTWADTNAVSSGLGQDVPLTSLFRKVIIPDLPAGARELDGKWAKINGPHRFHGSFLVNPIRSNKQFITTHGFDMAQTYLAITNLMNHLERLGFDMRRVLGDLGQVVVNVNTVRVFNAWFNPYSRDLTFGMVVDEAGRDIWHIAECHDTVGHEAVHLLIDCIARGLVLPFARAGGEMHEGIADAIPALLRRDAEIGEDFRLMVGKPIGRDLGLRTVRNNHAYDPSAEDVHDNGRAFGGMFWDVHSGLGRALGRDYGTAADLTLAFAFNAVAHLATNRPRPQDVVDAALAGAYAYLNAIGNSDPKLQGVVRGLFLKQAVRRGLAPRDGTDELGKRPAHTEAEFMEFVDARRNEGVDFNLAWQAATGLNGRDSWDQVLVTDKYGPIDVLGAGFIVFRDAAGEVASVSTMDYRPMDRIRVKNIVNVTPQHAVKLMMQTLQEREAAMRRALDEMPAREEGEDDGHIRLSYEEYEAYKAKQALEVAESSSPDQLRVSLVVAPEEFPNSDHLFYRIELPNTFAYVLVDAVTGDVRVDHMNML